jgi:ribosomal protein L37AE/L43A
MNIPENIYEQAYCKKCNERIIPRIKNKFFRKYEWICPKCGFNKLNWIKYNDGMDLYLKEIELM